MAAFRDANATVPAHNAVAITPSDVGTFPTTRGVYVGTVGDLTVQMADGNTVTFVNCASGTLLPIQVIQVRTASTATNILALY